MYNNEQSTAYGVGRGNAPALIIESVGHLTAVSLLILNLNEQHQHRGQDGLNVR